MRALLALIFSMTASAALASATCAPVSTDSLVLASADAGDIHPDWSDGSTIGLSWTLDLLGDEVGSDGEYYLYGDLYDPRGNFVNEGVYANVLEWECEPNE